MISSNISYYMQDYGWFAHLWSIGFLFGGLSLAGAVGLLIQAFFEKNISEIWHSISRLAWLVATYVWMSGDLDINPKNDPYQIKLERRAMCGHILIFTILFESINRFIVRPMLHTNPKHTIKTISSDELPTSLRKLSNYDEPRLTFQTLRFKFQALLTFETWRDYENFQLLFWIGRDLGAVWPCWYYHCCAVLSPHELIFWDSCEGLPLQGNLDRFSSWGLAVRSRFAEYDFKHKGKSGAAFYLLRWFYSFVYLYLTHFNDVFQRVIVDHVHYLITVRDVFS